MAGCESTSLQMPSDGEHPFLLLSDLTDDVINAYYYLGEDKIGCMDKGASNYLISAVLDDESCMYSMGISNPEIHHTIKIYPQPATTHVIIKVSGDENIYNKEFTIHNIVGEQLYFGRIQNNRNIKINTDYWTPGTYYMLIKMENKNLTHKFTIE